MSWVVGRRASKSASTRSRQTSGPGLDPGRLVVMAEDPAVECRDRDVDAGGAEVGDEDVPGIGAEGQLARRPAAGAGPDIALGDEATLEQLADALGDDRPAQPGPGDELRSASASRPRRISSRTLHEGVERLVRERSAWTAGARQRSLATARITGRMIRPFRRDGRSFALDRSKYDRGRGKSSERWLARSGSGPRREPSATPQVRSI